MRHKLEVGPTLSEVFAIYRDQFGVLIPTAFWLFLIVAVVNGIVGKHVGLLLLSTILTFVVALLYQGMVVNLVRDLQDGRRDSSVGDLLRSVGPVLGPLFVASLIYGICVAVGFVLLIVPGCILLTIWAVIAPAIVIERKDVFQSFGRSRELVRGNGWPVFGTVIAAALITIVVGFILAAIAEAIADGAILRIVFSALASMLTAPIGALVAAVLYYRLLEIKGESAPAGPGAPSAVPGAPPAEDFAPPPPPPSAGPGEPGTPA